MHGKERRPVGLEKSDQGERDWAQIRHSELGHIKHGVLRNKDGNRDPPGCHCSGCEKRGWWQKSKYVLEAKLKGTAGR